MRTQMRIKVPTGDILVVEGQRGLLELLSIGDYGAAVNLNQDREVPDGLPLLPLEEKWVITISTQYGCSMGCVFCDVPKVGPGRNASLLDMLGQVDAGRALHPEVLSTRRLNVHFARMGEPTWNPEVLTTARLLRDHYPGFKVHPVVSTMMPRHNPILGPYLNDWMDLKNRYFQGEAGLQLSINSTSDEERDEMFRGQSLSLREISRVLSHLDFPRGRKITLNFAVAGYTIDPRRLLRLFDPAQCIVKLTPMHRTTTALENGIETAGDYTTTHPYKHHAEALREAGFEVLVFIASKDEDLGRITCGNAILSGSRPLVPHEVFQC